MLIRTPAAPSTAAMASASALAVPATTAAAAPWRALFLQHLGQMPMPLCAVSTLHPASSSSDGGGSATPRVRSCVCRGLWASLPDSARNPAPRNPPAYESDLPVFTTDARMAKAWEIAASVGSAGSAGGGGPVEAVWWASEAGAQWRVRGTAWILGPDVEGPAGAAARDAIQKHMRRRGGRHDGTTAASPSAAAAWSWSREVTAHFGNLSPAMRGSFRNPPPGRPRPPRGADGNTRPGEGLGAPVGDDDLDDAAARANFRVCVIVPEEVDLVDLSKGDDPRRWLYTYVGTDAEEGEGEGEVVNGWAKVEVWP